MFPQKYLIKKVPSEKISKIPENQVKQFIHTKNVLVGIPFKKAPTKFFNPKISTTATTTKEKEEKPHSSRRLGTRTRRSCYSSRSNTACNFSSSVLKLMNTDGSTHKSLRNQNRSCYETNGLYFLNFGSIDLNNLNE